MELPEAHPVGPVPKQQLRVLDQGLGVRKEESISRTKVVSVHLRVRHEARGCLRLRVREHPEPCGV